MVGRLLSRVVSRYVKLFSSKKGALREGSAKKWTKIVRHAQGYYGGIYDGINMLLHI